jgi:alcohol dehydrogenase
MRVKAAVLRTVGAPTPYATSRPLDITEVELAPPGRGEVLVRLKATGLCHSDLSVMNGDRPRPVPMVLGHESAGIVVALGAGVEGLVVGDHVVTAFVPSCGHCGPCVAHRPALCEPGFAVNSAGTLLSGERRWSDGDLALHHHLGISGFADHAVMAAESLVRIAPDLPWEIAAVFGCAVLTGVGAVVNTAQVQAHHSVAVVGLGGVGLAALLGARAVGAREILAVDLHQDKLELAARHLPYIIKRPMPDGTFEYWRMSDLITSTSHTSTSTTSTRTTFTAHLSLRHHLLVIVLVLWATIL